MRSLSPLRAAHGQVCGVSVRQRGRHRLFDRVSTGRLGLAQLDPVAMKGHRTPFRMRLFLVGSGLLPRVWRIIT